MRAAVRSARSGLIEFQASRIRSRNEIKAPIKSGSAVSERQLASDGNLIRLLVRFWHNGLLAGKCTRKCRKSSSDPAYRQFAYHVSVQVVVTRNWMILFARSRINRAARRTRAA